MRSSVHKFLLLLTILLQCLKLSRAQESCNLDQNSGFECVARGRFKNPNDLTCTKWFLCASLTNGSFLQAEYTCPRGSYFDQSASKCTLSYECPCKNSSVIVSSSTEITSVSTTGTSEFTTPELCISNKDFSCTKRGRFRKPNDPSCTQWYLCSLLRNGTYLRTEYTCPFGSYFDQTRSNCNAEYQCPCQRTSSSTFSSTEQTTTTTTAKPVETTTESLQCRSDEDPNFVCSEKGRFKKPNDLTCTQYYLCSLLRNGSYLQTAYTCPNGSYFDQAVSVCNTEYQCPCETTSSSTFSSTEQTTATTTAKPVETTTESLQCRSDEDPNFVCREKGRFKKPNDLTCTEYYLCSLLRNGSYLQTGYTCPSDSYFDQAVSVCSTEYQCPCQTTSSGSTSTSAALPTTTKSPECTYNPEENFECAEEGRFKKTNDQTCTQYYLCSLLRNGTFLQTPYTCPQGTYFDPPISECSLEYQCPCVSSTVSSTAATTTTAKPVETTTEPSQCRTDEDPNFVCIEKGRFKKPNDLTCTQYYLCSLLRNGSYLQTPYTCPNGSYFDQAVSVCNTEYQCPCQTTSIGSTSTSAAIPTTTKSPECVYNPEENFVCAEEGRFKKINDQTCTEYYLCSLLRNGTFLQTPYTCPQGTYFDPLISECSLEYQCPCVSSTVSSTAATTTTAKPVETTTEPSQCRTDEDPNFVCSEKGRFKKPNDLTCSQYYLCSLLRNGSYLQTEYTCPSGSYFDQSSSVCNTEYDCPCISTSPGLVSTSTTISPECLIDENSSFECQKAGRFKKPNDLTCSQYYLCSLLNNDTLIQTEYTCPSSSYFNPADSLCSTTYKCPCTIMTPRSERYRSYSEGLKMSYLLIVGTLLMHLVIVIKI